MNINIIYEDKYIIVCIKPAGIISEDGGLPHLLSLQLSLPQVYCIHRLDKDVSGIMLYAKDGRTAARCSAMFANNLVKKEYIALVQNFPVADSGIYTDLLFHDREKNKTFVVHKMRKGVKEARLEYTVLQKCSFGNIPSALVQIRLQTGRSHQIRVQFASRRMPLIGDRKYGGIPCPGGIALFSNHLSFEHPVSGVPLNFSVPLPDCSPWNSI